MRSSGWRIGARGAAALTVAVIGTVAVAGAQNDARGGPANRAVAAEKPFLDESAAAMDRMMAGMDAKPTGNVDRDFVATMAPHHQGAVDMAQTYLRYGTNEQLRRVAQEIIVEQGQEIAAMNLAIGDPLPASAPAPTGAVPGLAAAASPTMDAHGHHATNH